MISRRIARNAGLVFVIGCAACGPSNTPTNPSNVGADGAAPAATTGSADGGTAGAAADGGSADRGFAGSIGEATQMINDLVDKRRDELKKCIAEFRMRKNLPREKVSIGLGIDQEGRLLGVTHKNKKDDQLTGCASEALKGLPFPKSHAGVITVSRTYEEIVQ